MSPNGYNGEMDVKYNLSRLIPVRFRSTYGVDISRTEVEEGGHGNHFVSGAHTDRERAAWWQWRGRIWGQQTTRTCVTRIA
jgi:hypothetical protein